MTTQYDLLYNSSLKPTPIIETHHSATFTGKGFQFVLTQWQFVSFARDDAILDDIQAYLLI